MTTEISTDTYKEWMASQSENVSQGFPPKLKTNKAPEDDEENRLPLGAYTVDYEGKALFMPTTSIRLASKPLYRFERIVQQKDGSYKLECGTVYEDDPFKGEYPDNLGSFKCGKVTGAKVDELSDTEKEANAKKGKYTLTLFVQVDISRAQLANGDDLFINPEGPIWYSCHMKFSGTRAMEVGKLLMSIVKESKITYLSNMFNLVKAKKEKTGDNVYYVPQFELGSPNNINEEYYGYSQGVLSSIDIENKKILDAHYAANMTEEDAISELKLIDEVEGE